MASIHRQAYAGKHMLAGIQNIAQFGTKPCCHFRLRTLLSNDAAEHRPNPAQAAMTSGEHNDGPRGRGRRSIALL
jgi:hypothetical protein